MSSVRATLVAGLALVRHLPLLFRATPKTPLRVLAIAALDTVHVLRSGRPMSRERALALATFLDFGACTNAAWDRKEACKTERGALEERLEQAGLESYVEDYVTLLRMQEGLRPSIGGPLRHFDNVREYREDVVRVSFAAAAAIALESRTVEEAIRATERDSDLEALFRLVMQCQVIDDVLDYTDDLSAGLPSFLTAVESLQDGVEMTAGVARAYGGRWERASGPAILPIRIALNGVSALAAFLLLFVACKLKIASFLAAARRAPRPRLAQPPSVMASKK